MRIVLDTGCLVTAVRSSSGASAEVLRTILREEIVLLMNLNLALEYRAVAVRKEHLLASVLRKAEILDLIDALEALLNPWKCSGRCGPCPRIQTTTWFWMSQSTDVRVRWSRIM